MRNLIILVGLFTISSCQNIFYSEQVSGTVSNANRTCNSLVGIVLVGDVKYDINLKPGDYAAVSHSTNTDGPGYKIDIDVTCTINQQPFPLTKKIRSSEESLAWTVTVNNSLNPEIVFSYRLPQ